MRLLVSKIQFLDQSVLFKGTTGFRDREYLGTISQVCVNADYAAVGFEGKVQLHQVINVLKTFIKHLRSVFCCQIAFLGKRHKIGTWKNQVIRVKSTLKGLGIWESVHIK